MSPTPDRRLADPQQTIAELRRDLERRTAERDESDAQKAAMTEMLRVINSSPGDLNPVFDAMLDNAMRLCDASGGALRSYDGTTFHTAAMRGVPEAFAEATRLVVPDPHTALGRIERGAHVIQVPDLTDASLSQIKPDAAAS